MSRIRTISEFRGAYFFLSNFYPLAQPMVLDGKTFPTSEHAYQAHKARTTTSFENVRRAPTPKEAKRLGCYVISLRDNWDEIKDGIMLKVLRAKFLSPDLSDKLLGTLNANLIEGNQWHDTYWGKCQCPTHNGEGKNKLGKLLMQVRDELAESVP